MGFLVDDEQVEKEKNFKVNVDDDRFNKIYENP